MRNLSQNQKVANHKTSGGAHSVIANHPLFCLLNKKDIHDLFLVTKEVIVPSDTVLTNEGEIVDSVYFILSGTAKVTRSVSTIEKTTSIYMSDLNEGDSIGLTETGFFSHSGLRTATVTTLTPMSLLKIDVDDLHHFMNKHTKTYPAFRKSLEKILLTNFIKEIFINLSVHEIQQIAKQIKKIFVKSRTHLFQKNDECIKCFYLLHGKMKIVNDENKIHVESPAILCKNEFLTKSKYNVDGITESDCELFILDREKLLHYLPRRSHLYRVVVNIFNPLTKLWTRGNKL